MNNENWLYMLLFNFLYIFSEMFSLIGLSLEFTKLIEKMKSNFFLKVNFNTIGTD